MWGAHPPPHISLDGLAVAAHWSAPSSPLVEKVVEMERRQLSWQRGWAVTSCWRDLRDGSIRDTEQCSEYAQAHLEFFTDQLAADAATTTCNLSRSHLAYARTSSPGSKRLLAQLQEEVKADCSHSDVSQ